MPTAWLPCPGKMNARVIASNLFPAGRGTGIGGPVCQRAPAPAPLRRGASPV